MATIAEHLKKRMSALEIDSYRKVARRVMAVEGRDPQADANRFDDWRDRISDYASGQAEPNTSTIRLLAAALEDDAADWPARRRRPSAADLEPRLEQLEAELDLWQALLREGFELLGVQVEPEADPGARVHRRGSQQRRAGAGA